MIVSFQGIISTLTTNTVGPLIMAKHFAPLLQKGGGGFGQQPAEKAKQHSGIVVNITAKVGSIGDNGWHLICLRIALIKESTSIGVCVISLNICPLYLLSLFSGLGGWYSYRMSKAALNMATRNLSIELGRSRPKVGSFPSSRRQTPQVPVG